MTMPTTPQHRDAGTALPPLLTDYAHYDEVLTWIERARFLLESVGGPTLIHQQALAQLTAGILFVAAGEGLPALGLVPPAPQDTPARPKLSRNGQARERGGPEGVTLNEVLAEMGYREIPQPTRTYLGQRLGVVYRREYGRAAPIDTRHGHRVCIYTPAEIPLVQQVVREVLAERRQALEAPGDEEP
jgi:hypothetical protein